MPSTFLPVKIHNPNNAGFSLSSAENDYFDQRLECAAPKRWLKYTTVVAEWVYELL